MPLHILLSISIYFGWTKLKRPTLILTCQQLLLAPNEEATSPGTMSQEGQMRQRLPRRCALPMASESWDGSRGVAS